MKNSSTRQLGLITVISLVAGGMIGSGIFSLPAVLGQLGAISLLGWILAAAGAYTLAIILGKLSKAIPESGGAYAYTKSAFGELSAFLVAWGYWLSTCTTNAAIALAFTGYLSVFFPVLESSLAGFSATALAAIWSLTALNYYSIRSSGNLQVVTTLLKILPLLIVAIGGFFFFDSSHFQPLNLSGGSDFQAITTASVLCFFAFMGIEAATIPADNIKNPKRNIPKGTLIGVTLVVFLYLFSTVSLFGVLSPSELASSLAPLSDAGVLIFGKNSSYIIALGACISTFGALNAWILIQGQISYAMAKDGLLPKKLAKKNRFGIPGNGLIFSSLLVTVVMIFNFSESFGNVYSFMIRLTTVTSLFFYLSASLAFGYFCYKNRFGLYLNTKTIILTLLGLGFSLWLFAGSGLEAILWGMGGIALGLPVYFWSKKKNEN
ncbi:amino acid permease [Algoriphagus kandeliae]|uniref:Arginine/agmatine antiporter n=1 Tax=Algoriphagus kandeliae TaxID=2562278 RepID=A0A4Y9R1S0_9BACT|nr:amino acid permease [Algoriphagus kandeliae]TFV97503.1 amino acid permease [Algoriphagus kandeliae]